jgi:enoyl-[acyl-carrier protein] reductase I
MSFLNLKDKRFLVFGVANKKSVAWHIAQILESEGAKVLFSVRSKKRQETVAALLGNRPTYVCDVEKAEDITALAQSIDPNLYPLDGIVHSIAFANYAKGVQAFHETQREDFIQATLISCFSIVEIARAFKPHLTPDASVVAISISSQVTAENYGYMSPIKSALESCCRFLAKSFSQDTCVRFNTVNSGPLKTSASAGIPGYLDNYLFAEQLTFRKQALTTVEVANTAAFLLSGCSSGINGQSIVVNAGMDCNYFDKAIVHKAMSSPIVK